MNRCRPYRFVHPLRGCVNTRGDAHPYQASVPAGTWWSGYLRSCQAAFLAEDDWSFAITTTHTFAHLPSVHYSLITDHSSHTFSAKERDAETGLSYFGARYYSSDLSIWLSVDPMSDKYPSLSPYVYCADNPVKLVDPNGEDTIFVNKKTGYSDVRVSEGNDIMICGSNKVTLSGNGVFAQAKGDENQSNDFQTLLTGMTGEDAAKVFNFMADNTDVEWGYMRTNSGEYFIGANHTNEGQDGESVISKMVMDALPNTVGNYTHSHWSDKYSTTGWTPSTFNTANDSKNSDHKAWKDILINQPKITMGIRYKGLTKCWIKKGKPVEGFDNFYTTD
nr:RHS repeat-associated core domain-containing protein [Frisingicoccus sp.]